MRFSTPKALLLSFVVLLASVGCQRHDTSAKPFRVGIATWPGFAAGFVAQEKGFFDGLPVEFSNLDDFSARQAAFTSGHTDATISTLDSYAFESAKGVDGRVAMILDESFGADAIVVKPSIKSPGDLKGKRIAYTRGSPSHFFLIAYLAAHGMSMSDVTRIEVDDPGRAGEAFMSGSVDAAVTWEPNVSQIVDSDAGTVLASTRTVPGLIVDVMVVSRDVQSQRPDVVQKFVTGWLRAVAYIEAHPDESYSIMARALKIPEAEFPQMMAGLRLADINRNRELLASTTKAIEIFDQAGAIWLKEGLIAAPRLGRDFITSDFIAKYQ